MFLITKKLTLPTALLLLLSFPRAESVTCTQVTCTQMENALIKAKQVLFLPDPDDVLDDNLRDALMKLKQVVFLPPQGTSSEARSCLRQVCESPYFHVQHLVAELERAELERAVRNLRVQHLLSCIVNDPF